MIKVVVNRENYISDILPLMRSFYTGEEIKVSVGEEVKVSVGEEDNIDNSDLEQIDFFIFVPEADADKRQEMTRSSGGTMGEKIVIKTAVKEYVKEPDWGEVNVSGLDSSDKVAIRNTLKRLLYSVLREQTKRELPWGVLTGIRPTRIALTKLNNGASEQEIVDFMADRYYVSDEKARLSVDIAKREKQLIDSADCRKGFSLYVGIPFCPTTCLYCSFASNPLVSWKDRIDEYLRCVDLELEASAGIFGDKNTPDSVYVGGGTPTTLEPYQLDYLLTSIKKHFNLERCRELCVESGRPDSITKEKLMTMKGHGVDRISINPQTMKDETLKIIGRRHTVQETMDAFKLARECGFTNINMDIILGLPDESVEDVRHTLEVIKELAPESLTVHSLALKRAAGLGEWMKSHDNALMNNSGEIMDMCSRAASELNMDPYYLYRQKNMAGNFENVGYATKECYGVYNILMMEEVQSIIACGAGTITKRLHPDGSLERCDNVKDVSLYIEKIEEMIDRKRELFKD